jgi:hypothetical protein
MFTDMRREPFHGLRVLACLKSETRAGMSRSSLALFPVIREQVNRAPQSARSLEHFNVLPGVESDVAVDGGATIPAPRIGERTTLHVTRYKAHA